MGSGERVAAEQQGQRACRGRLRLSLTEKYSIASEEPACPVLRPQALPRAKTRTAPSARQPQATTLTFSLSLTKFFPLVSPLVLLCAYVLTMKKTSAISRSVLNGSFW